MEEGAEVRNRQVIFKGYIKGAPKESEIYVKTDTTRKLKLPEGSKGLLVKNLYLSCDPYMRLLMTKRDTGGVFSSYTPGSVHTLSLSLSPLILVYFSIFGSCLHSNLLGGVVVIEIASAGLNFIFD